MFIRTLASQLTDLKRRHREEIAALKQALEAAHGENLELRRRVGYRKAGDAMRSERHSLAEPAGTAHEGTQADASMDVFNAMAEIRKAASRGLALPSKQQITFTVDRARAIAELCDGAQAAIIAVRDIVTSSALDDAALKRTLSPFAEVDEGA